MAKLKKNLTRDTLQKLQSTKGASPLVALKLAYSEDSKLLTGYVNKLVNVNRIYPIHLPTQASFRWSTLNPPITNWPRACINPDCQERLEEEISFDISEHGYIEHEWQLGTCWSVRDILLPDSDEVLCTWDHDNIEGRIHDLIVNDSTALQAHTEGFDLHTLTCCDIFGYDYPTDRRNPHTSKEDEEWRRKHKWQGKDTKPRVLAKNFNHGSKFTKTWRFVYRIQGIEKYGVTRDHLGKLARVYIQSKGDAWQRKLDIMQRIQKSRISRTLYGGRRVFFDSSEETGREGFSHMISGTVSDYNNQTLIKLEENFGDSIRLLHNAHDGDKVAFKKDSIPSLNELKAIIERPIDYEGRSVLLTAGVKVYD